jgi:hypothetical protein
MPFYFEFTSLMIIVMETDAHNSSIKQDHDAVDTQQRRCEDCRHFQKDEYTGYCRIHHAYVLKTFWCIQFEPTRLSEGA